ncbi:MAG: hypothetical protein AB7E49_10785, partial [Campylobacterales bacterium]
MALRESTRVAAEKDEQNGVHNCCQIVEFVRKLRGNKQVPKAVAAWGPLKILCQSDRILNPKGLTHEPNKPAVRSRHRFSADQGRSQ